VGKLRDYANDYTKRLEELQTLYSDMEIQPQHYTTEYINRVKRDIEIAKRNFPEILSMAVDEDRQIAQLRQSLIPTQGRNKTVDQKVDKLFPSTPSDAPQPMATKNVVTGTGGNGPDFNKWHSEYSQSIQEQTRRDQAARETPVSPLNPPQFRGPVPDATQTTKPVIPGTGPKMFPTTGEKTHDLNDLNATGNPAGFFDDPIQLSKNIGKQFLRGVEDHRINKMWANVSRGQFDQTEAMKIEQEFQQRAESDPIDADNWLSGIFHSTARMVGHMGATMLRSTGKAAGVGLGAGGLAAATGAGAVAAPAIGLAAAGMAAPLMNYLDWHDQAAGMMYRAMVTNKETPIDPKIASIVANIVAIPYAAVEMSQINRIAPGATRLGAKAIQNVAGFSVMDNLAKAAAKQTIPAIIGKNLKEYAATWGKEMGEELVQGQIELVSNEYAKHFNNMVRGTEYELNIDDVSKMSKEMAKNLWMTTKESAGPLALMTGPRYLMETKSGISKNKMADRSYQKEAIERMQPIPLNLEPEKLEIIKQGIQNNEDPKQTAKKAKTSLKAVEKVKKTLSEAQGESIIPNDQLPASNIPVQPEQAGQGNPPIVEPGQIATMEDEIKIQATEPEINNELINAQKIEHDAIEIIEQNKEEYYKLPSDIQDFIGGIADVGLDKAIYDNHVDDYYTRFNKILNDYPNLLKKYRATDPNYSPQNQLQAPPIETTTPTTEPQQEPSPETQPQQIPQRQQEPPPEIQQPQAPPPNIPTVQQPPPPIVKPVTKNTEISENKNTYSSAIENSIVGTTIKHGKIKWADVKSLLGKDIAENIVNPKKFIMEITSPNGVSLDEIAETIINEGGLTPNPHKQSDEHYLESLINQWNRIQNGDYFNENSQNPIEADYNAELEQKYGPDIHDRIKKAKIVVYGTNDIRTYNTKLEFDRAGESPQLWSQAKKEKGKYIILDEDLGLTPERNTRQPGLFVQNESTEELPFLVKQNKQKSGIPESVKSGGPEALVKTEKSPAASNHWVSSDLVMGNKTGKVMTVNDMINGVRKIFPDITFRPKAHKKMGKAAGFYERGTSFVRTRNDKDIQAITHELAHSLHYLKTKYNTWRGNQDFKRELTQLDYIPNRSDKKLAIIEGFAEFSRRWAIGDPKLPNLAPKFLDYFENTFLEENDPDGQWQELKQLLTEYREQDTKSYYDAGLVRSETRYERMMKNTNAFVERAKIHPLAKIQMTYARTISKLHDNARAAEVMLKLALGRSYHQLAYKDRFIELWRMTQGRAGESARRILFETFINPTTGEKMGKSLVDVFKSVCKTKEDMLEFEKYLKAKQLVEIYIDKEGDYILPHGQPIDHLRKTIDQIENDRPEFIKAREEYATFNNNLLKMVKDAGGFSDELYDNLKHHFSAWVPTEHETIESEYPGGTPSKGTSKAYANISQPIHKLKQGSEAPLVPFIDSYAKHIEKMIAFANKVRAVRSLIDIQDISGEMGEEIKKGLSKIVRVTDAPTSVKGIKIEVLVDALKGLGYEVKPGENATGLDELLNLYFSDYIPKNAKFGTVMVFKDGKPVYLELDKELYNLLMASGEGINYAGTNILMKALTKAGKMVRYGATTAKISFSLYSNLIADTINRMTASDQALSNPFQTFNGILAELVRKNKSSDFFTKLGVPADMAQKYLASGGAFSTQLGADAKALYDMQNQFKAAVTDHDIVFSLEHPFEAMRTVLSFTENANRIADFKEVYNKVLKQTGDKEEAYIRAVRSSQDVTIDFLRHGDWTKFMSVIKAFYNAQSQGLSKTMRNMTELTPTKYGEDEDGRLIVERNRVKGMYFIPKVIAWHFAMNILQRALMPEDKKEEFDGYQGWKKNGFWHFWIKGHHLWVPCKFVQGAIVNGLINLTMEPMKGKRHKEETAEFLGHVWNESLAGLIPLPNVQQWLSGTNIIGPFSDLAANKDAFGIPIEPVYARLNEPNRLKIVNDKTYGITTKATEMMHGLSKKTPMFTFMGDISPVQLQYFLGKITGGAYWRAGAWVQLVGDLATGKKITLEKAPVTNVLFREDNPLQRRPVRKFYENIKKADADKEYPNRERYKFIQKQINQFERTYKAYKLKQTKATTGRLMSYQRAYKIKIGLDDKDQFRREVLYNIISKGMEKIGDY